MPNLSKKKLKKKTITAFLDRWIKDGKKYGRKLPNDVSSRHTEYYLESILHEKSK